MMYREKANLALGAKGIDDRRLENFLSEYFSIKHELYDNGMDYEARKSLNAYSLEKASRTSGGKYKESLSEIAGKVHMKDLERQDRVVSDALLDAYIKEYTDTGRFLADLSKTMKVYNREKGYDPGQGSIEEIRLDDIVGLEPQKREIDRFIKAVNYPEIFEKNDARRYSGLLFYGPPGTGKTMLGKAIATELDYSFVHVKVSDIASKYFGESEKLMQYIFDDMEDITVLFLDELDSLAPSRDGDSEAASRIVSTLLVNLDGITEKNNIVPVGATNRIDAIDPALKRPGRFSKLIEVPLPDQGARENMFMKKSKRKDIFNIDDYSSLADLTEGYTGADIVEIMERCKEDRAYDMAMGKHRSRISDEEVIEHIKKYERSLV